MSEPVLCPISPQMVEMLSRPGGYVSRGPVKLWLDDGNVLHVHEIELDSFTAALEDAIRKAYERGDIRGPSVRPLALDQGPDPE